MSACPVDLPADALATLFSALYRARSERSAAQAEVERFQKSERLPGKGLHEQKRAGKDQRPTTVKASVKRGEQQAIAAQLLVSGKFKEEVARHVEVSSRTLRRWRKKPEFQRTQAECQCKAKRQNLRGWYGSKCVSSEQAAASIPVAYQEQGPDDQAQVRRWAARLVWEGEESEREIARQCGIRERTLQKWKAQPEFQREVEQFRKAGMRASEAQGLTEFRLWIEPVRQRWNELWAQVTVRAALPSVYGPGGRTGLLKPRVRRFGSAGDVTKICDFPLDGRLVRELSRKEEQVSKRLGQWGEPLAPQAEPTSGREPTWTRQKERASLLVAQNELRFREIAELCGINRRTLTRWNHTAEFQSRVGEHQQIWASLRSDYLIVDQRIRIRCVEDRLLRMEQIRSERAAGKRISTGIADPSRLLQWRWVQKGRVIKTDYVPDELIVAELRAHTIQLAKERGESSPAGPARTVPLPHSRNRVIRLN
jgi:transposase